MVVECDRMPASVCELTGPRFSIVEYTRRSS